LHGFGKETETKIAGGAGVCYESLLEAGIDSLQKHRLAARPKKGHIMADEAANRFAGASDRPGHSGGSPGEQSPLQTRAAFLKKRSWELVVGFNRGACARGGAQHGFNRETQEATAREWAEKQQQILSLAETLDFLLRCHRRAPFLFFNGNTFADIGRQLAAALFADLQDGRRREVASVVSLANNPRAPLDVAILGALPSRRRVEGERGFAAIHAGEMSVVAWL